MENTLISNPFSTRDPEDLANRRVIPAQQDTVRRWLKCSVFHSAHRKQIPIADYWNGITFAKEVCQKCGRITIISNAGEDWN